jgi:hypothetical protein
MLGPEPLVVHCGRQLKQPAVCLLSAWHINPTLQVELHSAPTTLLPYFSRALCTALGLLGAGNSLLVKTLTRHASTNLPATWHHDSRFGAVIAFSTLHIPSQLSRRSAQSYSW